MDQRSTISRQEADRAFDQGNLNRALSLYRDLDSKGSDPEISKRIGRCHSLLLRKYWRQGKAEEFEQLAGGSVSPLFLQLPCAKLKGREALQALVGTTPNPTAKLAQCNLQSHLKTGLLELRQMENFKEVAEGWLALTKGDFDKALQLFHQAEGVAPVEAKIGEGIAFLLKGDIQKANMRLAHLRPFAATRFPVLNKVMGWDGSAETSGLLLQHYLMNASLEELEAVERSSLPHHKALKGWVSLRIWGSTLYSQ